MAIEACLFPGQGLKAKDIVKFYNQLDTLTPQTLATRLAQVQEALKTIHGTSVFNVQTSLQSEASNHFGFTAFVQPIIYALSMTAYEYTYGQFKKKPDVVAGQSLGEYSAITAAGSLTTDEGIKLVAWRGAYMQEAYDQRPSTLINLVGVSLGQASMICNSWEPIRRLNNMGEAKVALINAPEVIVIGCEKKSADLLSQLATVQGKAKKVTSLETSGAFHTFYMDGAATKLGDKLIKFPLGQMHIPVISNLTGELIKEGVSPLEYLVASMTKPVQWAKTIALLRSLGVESFIESGPGTSLLALNSRNGIPKEQTRNILD